MLQAYIDDSGTKNSSDAFVLAGFVTEFEGWEKFSEEWKALRGRRGPLKMQKEKKRWQIDQRNDWISQHVRLIRRYAKYRIESAVSIQDYEDVMRGKVPLIVDSCYFFAFHRLISRVCEGLEKRGMTQQMDFFFDEQLKFGPEARKWFCMAKDLVPPSRRNILPPEPIFRKDEEFQPLQAADMFAWLVRRSHNEGPGEWEWLEKEIDQIEALPSPPLESDEMKKLLRSQEETFDPELIERWKKECV